MSNSPIDIIVRDRLIASEKVSEAESRLGALKEKIREEFRKYNINQQIQETYLNALSITKLNRYYERMNPEDPTTVSVREKYRTEIPPLSVKENLSEDDQEALAANIIKRETQLLERDLKLHYSIIFASDGNSYILDEGTNFKGEANLIGAGGFGRVKWAENAKTGDKVAIKIQKTANPNNLPDEIAIEQQVGILKATLVNKENFKRYNVYAYLGKDLNYFMADTPLFTEMNTRNPKLVEERNQSGDYISDFDKRMEIAIKMMAKIDEMHNQGIIHRDLKAANVMYNKDTKEVTIIDYGAAKKLPKGDSFIQLGPEDYAGTRTHIAPEVQIKRQKAQYQFSRQTDMYAAATTLMEIFGFPPTKFGEFNSPGKVNSFTKDNDPKIQHAKQLAWLKMEECIKKMQDIDPNKRTSANKARSELEHIQKNLQNFITYRQQEVSHLKAVHNPNIASTATKIKSHQDAKNNIINAHVDTLANALYKLGFNGIKDKFEALSPIQKLGYLSAAIDNDKEFIQQRGGTKIILASKDLQQKIAKVEGNSLLNGMLLNRDFIAGQKVWQQNQKNALSEKLEMHYNNLTTPKISKKELERELLNSKLSIDNAISVIFDENSTVPFENKKEAFRIELQKLHDKYPWQAFGTHPVRQICKELIKQLKHLDSYIAPANKEKNVLFKFSQQPPRPEILADKSPENTVQSQPKNTPKL